MTGLGRSRSAALVAALLATSVLAMPVLSEVISSDADGLPLPPSPVLPPGSLSLPGYTPLDVSADGRYVLFSNYVPGTLLQPPVFYPDCTIYRKDRATGELLTVFSSTADTRYYCQGARMSANGNIVVAPPPAPPEFTNPDVVPVDDLYCRNFGTVVELTVRDIASGSQRDITREWLSCQSRLPIGVAIGLYPGVNLQGLSGDGTAALASYQRLDGEVITEQLRLFDLQTEIVDELGDGLDAYPIPEDSFDVTGVAWSPDGSRIAVSGVISGNRPQFDRFVGNSSIDWNCDDPRAGSWCALDPPEPANNDPIEYRVYLIERDSGAITELEPLRRTDTPVPDLYQQVFRLRPDSLSNRGRILSWVEAPALCWQGEIGSAQLVPCGADLEPCVAEGCELRITRYNIETAELDTEYTRQRDESWVAGTDRVQLASNGSRLLYARTVRYPFGDDWEVPAIPAGYRCLVRESVDSLSGTPVEEECGLNLGPGPQGQFDAPLLWYLRDLNTGLEYLVSVTTDGRMVQSSAAALGNNGRTLALASRDPRLRADLDITARAGLDESLLPAACFWSSPDAFGNLRVATNDNTRYTTTATRYIYPATPELCLAPTPPIDAQVFVADIVLPVPVELPEYVESSGGAFGWLTAPILGLWLWRRQRAASRRD